MSDRVLGIVMLWFYTFVVTAFYGTVVLLWVVTPWWVAAGFTLTAVPPASIAMAWVVYMCIGAVRYDDVLWDSYGPHRREKPLFRIGRKSEGAQ